MDDGHLVSYLLNVYLDSLRGSGLLALMGPQAAAVLVFRLTVRVQELQELSPGHLSQGGCATCILRIEPRHALHGSQMLLNISESVPSHQPLPGSTMMPCSLPISHQGGKVEQFWRQACLQLLGKLKLDFFIVSRRNILALLEGKQTVNAAIEVL